MHASARKYFLAGVSVAILLGYGYFVMAVAPSGGYEPGEILNPVCAPGDTDCSVRQAWGMNTTSDYVFNITDSIGVGINAPTALFHLKGSNTGNTTSLLFEDSVGTDVFKITNAGRVTQATAYVPTSSEGVIGAYGSTVTIVPTASITSAGYSGISTTIEWDPNNIGYNLTTPPVSYLTGNLSGADIRVIHGGSGNIEDVFGATFNVDNGTFGAGDTGDITGDAIGVQGVITNFSTGSMGDARGLRSLITNQSSGTFADVTGVDSYFDNNSVAATGSVRSFSARIEDVPSVTTGVYFRMVNVGIAGDISSALSIEGNSVSVIDGISSDGAFAFMSLEGFGAVYGINADEDAYGVYINDRGLNSATGTAYGLYINDGENFLVNGLRIGADSNNNKIDDGTNGVSSTVLYIGTNTIDTTAPSDERTKKNIFSTNFGLDDLNKINVVDFVYDQSIINDQEKDHTGVLAQEIQDIYPEAVTKRSDGYFMVDYKTFIPLIIKSVQDLDIKLESIQSTASTVSVSSGVSFKSLRTWFADVKNGIEKFFAREIETKNLCISNDRGDKTCISKSQLDDLLQKNSVDSSKPEPEPESEEDSESTVEIISVTEEDMSPESSEEDQSQEESSQISSSEPEEPEEEIIIEQAEESGEEVANESEEVSESAPEDLEPITSTE